MGHHRGFGVMLRLEFQQYIAAPGLPRRIGTVQHQALAAVLHHLLQPGVQRPAVGDALLPHHMQPARIGLRDAGLQRRDALAEGAGRLRPLVDLIADRSPLGIVSALAPHRCRQPVEIAPAHPQLAIQRVRRQPGHKPVRRRNDPAAAKAQHPAIPQCAHAVELFAHQISSGIDRIGEVLRQQQRRRDIVGRGGNSMRRQGRLQHPAQQQQRDQMA